MRVIEVLSAAVSNRGPQSFDSTEKHEASDCTKEASGQQHVTCGNEGHELLRTFSKILPTPVRMSKLGSAFSSKTARM